jgi:hypothetical protein
MDTPKPDLEDIFEWPDGTTCTREEHHFMNHMSDDFTIHYYDSPSWHKLNK